MKKIFTIDDIEEFLKELDFEWIDRYVYNTKTKEYERAKMSHFKDKPVFVYLKTLRNNRTSLVLITVTNHTFIIDKLDASMCWKDTIETKNTKVGI